MGHPRWGGGEALVCEYRRGLQWLGAAISFILAIPGFAFAISYWDKPVAVFWGVSLSLFPAGAAYVMIFELLAKGPIISIEKGGIFCRRVGAKIIPWDRISAAGVLVEGVTPLLRIATPFHDEYQQAPYFPLRLLSHYSLPITVHIDGLDKKPEEILDAICLFYGQSETEAQAILDYNPVVGGRQFKPLIWLGNWFGIVGDNLSIRQKILGAATYGLLLTILGIGLIVQAFDSLEAIASEVSAMAAESQYNDLFWGLFMVALGGSMFWRARQLRSLYSASIPQPKETQR